MNRVTTKHRLIYQKMTNLFETLIKSDDLNKHHHRFMSEFLRWFREMEAVHWPKQGGSSDDLLDLP